MNTSKTPLNKGDEDKGKDKDKEALRGKQMAFIISYILVTFVGMWLFQEFILTPMMIQQVQIPYSDFKTKIDSGQIVSVTLGQERITGKMKNPDAASATKEVPFTTVAVPNGGDPKLIEGLDAAQVQYTVAEPASPLGSILLSYLLPMVLIGGIWYMGYRQTAGGMGGMGSIFGVGKSKATEVKPETIGITPMSPLSPISRASSSAAL